MPVCTFFGHRDCPETVKTNLFSAIEKLITLNNVRIFYVGNHGNFDRLVVSVLKELKNKYPEIKYYVVLAYLPSKSNGTESYETIFPEGIENVPKRFAIDFRNRWMIEKSDCVVTCINRGFGGAAKAKSYAEKHGKNIIEI